MCGRYTLKTPPDHWGQLLLPILNSAAPDDAPQDWKAHWQPRYNIAPTQNILAVQNDKDGTWYVDFFRWGLVPSWATELSIGNRMINARAETIDEKRSFAPALKQRRCLVIADGYYEWQKQPGGRKQACWIAPPEGCVVCFAGLWELNTKATGKPVKSCTIITTGANAALAPIHDRMPAILIGVAAQQWMRPDCSAQEAKSLLAPADDDLLHVRRVNNQVNNPRNESPQCIEPTEDS
jgi:putative SOS response-associated peptidase YedK